MIGLADARALPLADASVDAIVCDPPYEYAFMGRAWDRSGVAFQPETWTEALRVAKPGAHLLAFGGTRTYHRLACAVEDAGWEIRDSIGMLGWVQAQGFPKSLDVSKAIDRMAGVEREVVAIGSDGASRKPRAMAPGGAERGAVQTMSAPATEDAARWQGWGTALKPAWEPIIVARKPLAGSVAGNVLAYGTGALNVDACRVEMSQGDADFIRKTARPNSAGAEHVGAVMNLPAARTVNVHAAGRWPTNLVLVHHPDCAETCAPGCPAAELDAQSGNRPGAVSNGSRGGVSPIGTFAIHDRPQMPGRGDAGGASRFYPQFRFAAKAPTRERPVIVRDGKRLSHPTVKPVSLMRWLVRLVTPPGGLVLDPFCGSGATLEAATLEAARAVGFDTDPDSIAWTRQRLRKPLPLMMEAR